MIDTATAGVQEIDTELTRFGAADKPDPTVIDKAKSVGLEHTYAIVYRDSSAATHTSPMLLGEYLVSSGPGGKRMADYGPMLLIVVSQVIARLCDGVGAVVEFASSERAREHSARLAALGDQISRDE